MRIVVLIPIALTAGCLASSDIDCGNGWRCPAGFACITDPAAPTHCIAPTCGNGSIEAPESCDGDALAERSCADFGFYGGTLACDDTCAFDTSGCSGFCGDGITNGGEMCDGDVPADCADLGIRFDDGRPTCTEQCAIDVTTCEFYGFDTIYDSNHLIERFCTYDSGTSTVSFVPYYGGDFIYYLTTRAVDGVGADVGGSFSAKPLSIACNPAQAALISLRTLYRLESNTWTAPAVPSMLAVGALDEASLISVGYGGGIVSSSGAGWNVESAAAGNEPQLTVVSVDAVTGFGAAGGSDNGAGTMWQRSPSASWTTLPPPFGGPVLYALAVGTGTIYAGSDSQLLRWTGSSWDLMPIGPGPIAGRATDRVFVATGSTLWHFDGRIWMRSLEQSTAITDVKLGPDGTVYIARGSELAAARRLWFVGPHPTSQLALATGVLVGISNSELSVNEGSLQHAGNWGAITATTGYAFASSAGEAARYDLMQPLGTWLDPAPHIGGTGMAATALGPNEAYFTTTNAIFQYQSGVWSAAYMFPTSEADPGGDLLGIAHAPTTGEVIAVGIGGAVVDSVLRPTWTRMTITASPTTALRDVWMTDDQVFVVGDDGTIMHRVSGTWAPMTSGTTHTLNAIDGTSTSDIVAVGDRVILHFDGTRWTSIRPPVGGLVMTDVTVDAAHIYIAAGSATYVLYRP